MGQQIVYLKAGDGKIAVACGAMALHFAPEELRRLADAIDIALNRESDNWISPVCDAELSWDSNVGRPSDDGSDTR